MTNPKYIILWKEAMKFIYSFRLFFVLLLLLFHERWRTYGARQSSYITDIQPIRTRFIFGNHLNCLRGQIASDLLWGRVNLREQM